MKNNTDVFESSFAHDIFKLRYSINKEESWKDVCIRNVESVCGQYLDNETKENIFNIIYSRKFVPGGRYLASAGKSLHQICNCFALFADDSRESWAETLYKITMMLSTGGGVGVEYSKIRPEGSRISRTGGLASGPISLMKMINEVGRQIRSGGDRRSALWAGLNWLHEDIYKFLECKNRTEFEKVISDTDPLYPLPLDGTNISIIYDSEFFRNIEDKKAPYHKRAVDVWEKNCRQAFSTAEPGMCFNFLKDSESGRNACTEYITSDDSDSCNLGSIYINRISNKDEMAHVVKYANAFLMCGGIYTDLPTPKCRKMRDKNNNIGLGLGGISEWMLMNGCGYSVSPELHKLLNVWKQESDSSAYMWARHLGVSIPKYKRAIAPNGTTSIIAETTGGIEPIFCKAYKRRYYDNGNYKYQYVVDSAVKRLMNNGIKIENIIDAYDIPFKQRVKVQSDFQNYVDMGISSTCNISSWETETNNEETLKEYSKILLKYAKRLRGFTVYPDGCRNGQPLNRCNIQEAIENEGKIFESVENTCLGGICGT